VPDGFDLDTFDAMDATVIIRRGFIIDKLNLCTPKADILADILKSTGLNNAQTWLDRIAKIDKIRKDNNWYDWRYRYSDATWTKFRNSDAAVRLDKRESKKEPQPPSTRKREVSAEDAPVNPVKPVKTVDSRSWERTKTEMQLNAAAALVAVEIEKNQCAKPKIMQLEETNVLLVCQRSHPAHFIEEQASH
jgi:hypothetical protein